MCILVIVVAPASMVKSHILVSVLNICGIKDWNHLIPREQEQKNRSFIRSCQNGSGNKRIIDLFYFLLEAQGMNSVSARI